MHFDDEFEMHGSKRDRVRYARIARDLLLIIER
jgi:hypothetical protein